jgi:uncharacterized RDD family membrane protein YckC
VETEDTGTGVTSDPGALPDPAAAPPIDPTAPPSQWAPQSQWTVPAPRPEIAPGVSYGSVGRRFVAYWVDRIIETLVILLCAGAIGSVLRGSTANVVLALLVAAITAGYWIIGWRSSGQATPGMRLMSLRIGSVDGSPLRLDQAVARYAVMGDPIAVIGYLIPSFARAASGIIGILVFVLLVSVAVSATRQGLHDRVAASVVVQPTGASSLGWVVGLILIVALLALLSIVALIFLGGQVSRILSDVGRSI